MVSWMKLEKLAIHACSQLASYVTDEIDSRLQKLNLF